jgi:hypothetical protein
MHFFYGSGESGRRQPKRCLLIEDCER